VHLQREELLELSRQILDLNFGKMFSAGAGSMFLTFPPLLRTQRGPRSTREAGPSAR
jgi:hypothetical protein